jgi:hypothetical protein
MSVTDSDLSADELDELEGAMAVVRDLPRDALEQIVRSMVRAAIFYRRSRKTEVLEAVMRSLVGTIRRRRRVPSLLTPRAEREYVDADAILAKQEM